MNEPDLSFIKSDIDLSEVAPLNRRRVVAFVNCYLYKMIDFLNAFANRAERAILEAERQLRAADIKLQLLEAKLASIPDSIPDTTELQSESSRQTAAFSPAGFHYFEFLCFFYEAPPVVNEPKVAASQNADVKENPQAAIASVAETIQSEAHKRESNENASKGVVEPAVKLKMQSEGVDPSML
ncbi:hypothetical protein OSTOST_13764, partial [Ostertagia ostertagi]